MSDTNNSSRTVKVLAVLVGLLVIAVIVQSWFLLDLRRSQESATKTPDADSLFYDGSNWPGRQRQWDPFQEMQQLQDRIDQLFGESFGRFDSSPQFGHLFSDSGFSPQIDLKETDREFVARINVPGAAQQNLNVSVENQVLTVTGSIEEETEDDSGRSLRRERRSGEFKRSITLPSPVDEAAMTSEYKNGVLEVHIPKKAG